MSDIDYLKKYLPKEKLEEGLLRLEKGEPVQYIVGNVSFYGYPFLVNPSVLIPRFETEELVEKVLMRLKSDSLSILDLGCGSGCIAITLKKKIPNSKVVAVDISKEALQVAKKNANLNQVDITFFESDLFDQVEGMFDLIISNPPYISKDERIEDVVYHHEPHLALFAEEEGIEFYHRILKEAPFYLKKNGMIAFEIGSSQGRQIEKLVSFYFPNKKVEIQKDIMKLDRFLFIE